MPNQMTPGQARVIDPIISTAIRGYSHPGRVGNMLFPVVNVAKTGGTRIEFGKEDFKAVNTRRAPGARVAEVQFGHSGLPFALTSHALAGKVPQEMIREAAGTPASDVMARAGTAVMAMMLLELEREQAALATNAANYPTGNKVTLVGTAKWSDAASDPLGDVETAKEAIRSKIGLRPNTMIVGASVMSRLRNHPKIIDAVKYTSFGVPTVEQIRNFFGVPQFGVGEAITAAADDTFSDVWGDFVILAYTTIGSSGMGEPSFAYTYQLTGSPNGSEAYFDRSVKSWLTDVEFDRSPEIVGPEAGYLISDVL